MKIRYITSPLKWVYNSIITLIVIFFIWSFISMVIEENNPIIKSIEVHQVYLDGGVLKRAMIDFRIRTRLLEIIKSQTKNDIRIGDIHMVLVNLDNDTSTIEALALLDSNEDAQNNLYIFQAFQTIQTPKTKNEKLLGVLKNIKIPLSLNSNSESKWLDIVNQDDKGLVTIFSFINGQYKDN